MSMLNECGGSSSETLYRRVSNGCGSASVATCGGGGGCGANKAHASVAACGGGGSCGKAQPSCKCEKEEKPIKEEAFMYFNY